MIDRINSFIVRWWQGLASPWGTASLDFMPITIESGCIVPPNQAELAANSVLIVPSAHLLSSKIQSSDADKTLEELISISLPFSVDEVYAKRQRNTLFAVLRQDVDQWSQDAAAKGLAIDALQFDATDSLCILELATKPSSKRPMFIFAACLTLITTALFVVSNRINANLATNKASIQQQIDRLEANLSDAAALPTMATTAFDLAIATDALVGIKVSLPLEAEITQISLTQSNEQLSIVIDAEAKSGAELLSKLEQHSAFDDSDFVSAISADRTGMKERFRLRTRYAPSSAVLGDRQ